MRLRKNREACTIGIISVASYLRYYIRIVGGFVIDKSILHRYTDIHLSIHLSAYHYYIFANILTSDIPLN